MEVAYWQAGRRQTQKGIADRLGRKEDRRRRRAEGGEGRGGKLKVSRPLTEGKNSRTGRTEEEEEGYLRNEMNSAGVSEWVTP